MLIQNWFYSVIVNRCFYFINLLKYSWLPVQTMKTIVLDHFFLSKIQFWILILCKALIPLIIDMINFTMQVRWALWSYSLWMLHYSSLCKGLIMWSLNKILVPETSGTIEPHLSLWWKSLQIQVRWAVQSKSLLLDPQSYLPYSNMLWCIYMLHSFHSMFTLCVLSLTENE